jgi:hypothetical protein
MATPPTGTLQTIILQPGQCTILPKDAVITSVILDGAISVTSSCGELPPVSTYVCGSFFIWIDNDDNDGHSMNEENTLYTSLKVGGNTYMINEKIVQGENPGTATAVGVLNLHITNLALFEFTSVDQADGAKKSGITLNFRVPEELFDTIELTIDNGGSAMRLVQYESECE